MESSVQFWRSTILNKGVITALLCLNHYEAKERYEVCADIFNAIQQINSLVYSIDLPTRLHEEFEVEVKVELRDVFSIDAGSVFVRYDNYANEIIAEIA